MTTITYVALLRGINVSGQKNIRMAGLKALFESLGFSDVQTYLQSGNVIFTSPAPNPTPLSETIEAAITQQYNFKVSVLLRTPAELRLTAQSNPFINDRGLEAKQLYLTFCAAHPVPALAAALKVPAGSVDEFQFSGSEIYLYCPVGYGRTRLSNNFFETKLKVQATTRSWNTLLALVELSGQVERGLVLRS